MKLIIVILFIVVFNFSQAQLIPFDKKEHFTAGVFLGIGGSFITNDAHPITNSIIVATAGGVGKELYDKVSGNGVYDRKDIYYTILGGVVSGVATHYIKNIIKKRKKRRFKLRYKNNESNTI